MIESKVKNNFKKYLKFKGNNFVEIEKFIKYVSYFNIN